MIYYCKHLACSTPSAYLIFNGLRENQPGSSQSCKGPDTACSPQQQCSRTIATAVCTFLHHLAFMLGTRMLLNGLKEGLSLCKLPLHSEAQHQAKREHVQTRTKVHQACTERLCLCQSPGEGSKIDCEDRNAGVHCEARTENCDIAAQEYQGC